LAILIASLRKSSGKGQVRYCVRECRCCEVCRSGNDHEDLYDSIFDINVKGLLFTVQKALPLLPDGASIVLNASIVASKGCRRIVCIAPLKPRSFLRAHMDNRFKDRRIRVNAVSPGSIDTPD